MSLLRYVPNILTGSRLFFAVGYLLLLWFVDHRSPSETDVARLNWSFILFVIAGLTDVVDGWLARRLNVTSKFGRSFDPLADKLAIIGGFVLLAYIGSDCTAVAWWMVVVIIVRELLVTVARNISESRGRAFGANWAGKLKMFLQSFAIGTVIIYLGHFQVQGDRWAVWLRDVMVWVAVLFTGLTGVLYAVRIWRLRLVS